VEESLTGSEAAAADKTMPRIRSEDNPSRSCSTAIVRGLSKNIGSI